MNYSTAVFLINDSVRAVTCTYEEGAKRVPFKTFDRTVKIGDLAVVPTSTRHGMTVCKVVEVDSDVDFDDATPMQWIVAKIDRPAYQSILDQEAEAVQVISSADKAKKRAELQAALLANAAGLKALPITTASGD